MPAGRLLGPSEALFWLLGQAQPFNIVAVADLPLAPSLHGLRTAAALPFPVAQADARGRPRWHWQPADARVDLLAPATAWLPAVAALLHVPLGVPGAPAWHAQLLPHAGDPTRARLLLACHHAVADWRALAWALPRLAAGLPCDRLAPPCEEQLEHFARADAADLLDAWYAEPVAARWQALGPGGLQRVLPPAEVSLMEAASVPLPLQALRAACRAQGCAPGALLAAAAAAVHPHLRNAAMAVDMARVAGEVRPAALGLALSHATVAIPAGPGLGEAAAAMSLAVRTAMATGRAADPLLMLPDALLGRTAGITSERAALGVTGYRPFACLEGEMPLACFSGARAGGHVLALAALDGQPHLVASRPAGLPALDLPAIAGRMAEAARAGAGLRT